VNSLDILFKEEIQIGKMALADYIKAGLYSVNEAIFERLDFENDAAFLDPLLIAYLSSGCPSHTTLEQILCAYFTEKQGYFEVISDADGTVYVPQVGYFYTEYPNQKLLLEYDGETYQLKNISYGFLPCLTVLDGKMEIYRHKNPLLNSFYQANDNRQILDIEVTQTTHHHIQSIASALEILKTHLPNLYEEITLTNRLLSVFFNPQVNCFANIGATGCAFLSAIPTNETIFFIEELIHQCSHNTFNIMLFNRFNYFKIDVEQTQLGNVIGLQGEERSIFSAFHGLYTVAKRYEAFYELYKADIFFGIQKHEFLGRFADLKKRFRTGLELLPLEDVYTNRGKEIYQLLDTLCAHCIKKIQHLEGVFDLSNQPSEFSYAHFLQINPFEKFMVKGGV